MGKRNSPRYLRYQGRILVVAMLTVLVASSAMLVMPWALGLATTALAALVEDHCLEVTAARDTDPTVLGDQTLAQVGQPITYTLTISSCSTKPQTTLRRIKALLPASFGYMPGTTTTTYSPPPQDLAPEENACDGVAPDYYPCPQSDPPITDGTVLLNWPDGTSNYAGPSVLYIPSGTTIAWTFQATPSQEGEFFMEAIVCYFSAASGDPGSCTGQPYTTYRTGKVAPVMVSSAPIPTPVPGLTIWGVMVMAGLISAVLLWRLRRIPKRTVA